MSCKNKIYTLQELLTIKYGKNQKKVQDNEKGKYPIYGTGGLMGYAKDFLYDKPSVLIGRKGSISKVKYVEHPFWTVDTLFYTEVNEEIVIPKYLYYKMSLIDLSNYNEGTTIPSLRTETLNRIELQIPTLEEQKATVKLLDSLDKKIELNNEMNKTLEEMAQALFKRWFVDFEFPNDEGEPYKSSGGEMVESELGMIPCTWSISKLGDICEVKGGKRLPKGKIVQDTKTDYPYLRVTDVTKGYVDMSSIKYIDEETREVIQRYIINYEDIYISIAGTVGLVGTIPKELDNASLTENMARIITKTLNRNYINLYMNSEYGMEHIKSTTVGSTQPKLPLYAIKSMDVIIPNIKILDEFSKVVDSIYNQIEANLGNSIVLKDLRDSLLPKLMSGEIRVEDIEANL
ncbi:restriction endonuclease subunit S [Clostridium sp.]|uniref:restriction endonuclease subunit S n=1 Tax=Clostridium sp. TaxID=1506 RepID=UPI001DEB4F8F|nr:restriction endonuclease subunit S [Clostridium sp.]MBS5936803.1 restriction endonuclease subunit S [Clostridium sp.]